MTQTMVQHRIDSLLLALNEAKRVIRQKERELAKARGNLLTLETELHMWETTKKRLPKDRTKYVTKQFRDPVEVMQG